MNVLALIGTCPDRGQHLGLTQNFGIDGTPSAGSPRARTRRFVVEAKLNLPERRTIKLGFKERSTERSSHGYHRTIGSIGIDIGKEV